MFGSRIATYIIRPTTPPVIEADHQRIKSIFLPRRNEGPPKTIEAINAKRYTIGKIPSHAIGPVSPLDDGTLKLSSPAASTATSGQTSRPRRAALFSFIFFLLLLTAALTLRNYITHLRSPQKLIKGILLEIQRQDTNTARPIAYVVRKSHLRTSPPQALLFQERVPISTSLAHFSESGMEREGGGNAKCKNDCFANAANTRCRFSRIRARKNRHSIREGPAPSRKNPLKMQKQLRAVK